MTKQYTTEEARALADKRPHYNSERGQHDADMRQALHSLADQVDASDHLAIFHWKMRAAEAEKKLEELDEGLGLLRYVLETQGLQSDWKERIDDLLNTPPHTPEEE